MYDALFTKPLDYFKMLFGIKNDAPYFDKYYSEMNHWYKEFDSNLYNDSHTIIRFNALMRLFSFGFYNVHTVFMCFISLVGLTAIYKTFVSFLANKKKELIFAVFLLPSVLFWGSGVLKESILFFGLGLLVYHLNKLAQGHFNTKYLLIIIFSIVLVFYTKFYILVSVIPGMIAFYWVSKTGNRNPALKYFFVFSLVITLGLNFQFFFPGYDPLEILSIKQRDFVNLANGGIVMYNNSIIVKIENSNRDAVVMLKDGKCCLKPGSTYQYWDINNLDDTLSVVNSTDTSAFKFLWNMPESNSKIDIGKLEPDFRSFVRNAPKAFFNVMFRPFLFESKSLLVFTSAIENTFILFFIVFSLLFFKPMSREEKNVFLFCCSFVLILYVIIGLTTPVLGAIVRYKTPAIPFLLIAFITIIDKEKVLNKFPKLLNFFIPILGSK